MYKSERYELTAEDNFLEKLDAKVGNVILRSEELAEIRHQTKMEKQRAKYYKAKAKADAAEYGYNTRHYLSVESHDKAVKNRVIYV